MGPRVRKVNPRDDSDKSRCDLLIPRGSDERFMPVSTPGTSMCLDMNFRGTR